MSLGLTEAVPATPAPQCIHAPPCHLDVSGVGFPVVIRMFSQLVPGGCFCASLFPSLGHTGPPGCQQGAGSAELPTMFEGIAT